MTIKRIFASLSAQVDTLVSNMENHEAVAECAIAQARQYTAKLNAQLKLNSDRVRQLASQLEKVDQQIAQWQERAKRSACEDREKALRCLQAMKNCQQQRELLLGQLSHTQSLEVELREHLQVAEQQLLDLQHKKASLSARTARSKVINAAQNNPVVEQDTQAVFVRWEEKVLTEEYSQGAAPSCDDQLNAAFSADENRIALEAELDALVLSDTGSNIASQGEV